MSEDFLERNGLDLQISLLACQAVESGDPMGFLSRQLPYQNLSEYHLHETGPLRFLLLLSDTRAAYAVASKGSAAASSVRPKLQPTAYFAVANRVIDANAGLPPASFANFCSTLSPCNFELSQGAHIQSLVISLLAGLPLFTLLNLLGQGYKIVFAGRQFGGVIAHALAAKLLLQVQFEIQTAQKMGVDLSALSRTGDKVTSFAFSAPLFADSALQRALASHGLTSNLHTIWRVRDASAGFLTMCGDTFTALGAAGAAAAGAASRSGIAAHAGSQAFKALQRWVAAAQEELSKAARKDIVFAAAPLDLSDLSKAPPAAPAGHRAEAGEGEDGGAGAPLRPKPLVISAAAAKPGVGALSSPTGRPQAKPVVATARPVPRGSENGAVTRASAAGAVRTSGSGAAPAAAPRRPPGAASPRAAHSSAAKDAPPSPSSAAAAAAAAAAGGAPWKTALQELLAARPEGGEALQAVGQFWLVDGAPPADVPPSPLKPKAGTSAAASSTKAAAAFAFTELAPGKAASTSLSWLAPGNKDMFTRWESSLEELKHDLLELYAWTTFKTTVEVNGAPMDRKEALRPTRMQMQ